MGLGLSCYGITCMEELGNPIQVSGIYPAARTEVYHTCFQNFRFQKFTQAPKLAIFLKSRHACHDGQVFCWAKSNRN